MANLIPNNVLFSTIDNSLSDFMIGAVQAFATNNPGNGWITCDGQEVKRSEYPKLFSKIGNSYGTPSNDTYFKIPAINNNGYFIRGGFDIASVQSDAIRNITGEIGLVRRGPKAYNDDKESSNDSALYTKERWNTLIRIGEANDDWGSVVGFDASRSVPTADEVRPKNMTLRYYIFAGL